MKKIKVICALLGVMALFTGCVPTNNFQNKSYRYEDSLTDFDITINFDKKESRIFGSAGINRYFGHYELIEDAIKISPLGSTMMAGPLDAMNAEQAYLKALQTVTSFEIKPNELILISPNQKMIFKEINQE